MISAIQFIILFSRYLRLWRDNHKDKSVAHTSRRSFNEIFWNQEDTFIITEKILLISNVEQHKKVYSGLRCLSTYESVSSSFLRQNVVVFHINSFLKENSMNFIIELLFNCYKNNIYDVILVIVDCYLKMTFYIFTKLTWSIEDLAIVLFNNMFLIFFEIKKMILIVIHFLSAIIDSRYIIIFVLNIN